MRNFFFADHKFAVRIGPLPQKHENFSGLNFFLIDIFSKNTCPWFFSNFFPYYQPLKPKMTSKQFFAVFRVAGRGKILKKIRGMCFQKISLIKKDSDLQRHSNSILRYECVKVLFRRMRSLSPERSEGNNRIRHDIVYYMFTTVSER